MYQLLIDRTSLGLILACLGLVLVLIFFGGLLVGVHRQLPPETEPAPAGANPAAAPVRSPRPSAPVLLQPAAPEPPVSEPPVPEPTPATAESLPQEPPATAAEPAPPLEDGGRFAVQVGAYESGENLQDAIADLKARGYSPAVVTARGSDGRVFYRVLLGTYETRQEAQQEADELVAEEGLPAFVREREPASGTGV